MRRNRRSIGVNAMILEKYYHDVNNYTVVYLNGDFKTHLKKEMHTYSAWVINKETKEIQVCINVRFTDGTIEEFWFKENEFEFCDFYQQRVLQYEN